MKALLSLTLIASFLVSCNSSSPLPPVTTVKNFDLNRYDGEWHEISRLPNTFEKGIVAAKATYGVGLAGPVSILNEGLKENGETTAITGHATIVSDGKLKVRFDPFPANLFTGNYWVLWVNKSYTRAIVGSPNRKYLWLLAKDLKDQASDFTEPLQYIKTQGFNIENLYHNPKRLPPAKNLSYLASR